MIGINPGWQITEYNITSGNEDNTFALDFKTVMSNNQRPCIIKALKPLDHEKKQEYVLKLVAVGNDKRVSTQTSVKILVQDSNDNSPVFDKTTSKAAVSFLENMPKNFPVAAVKATDLDLEKTVGTTKVITYKITAGDSQNHFNVPNAQVGTVVINANLDRETLSEYNLTITASDDSGSSARSTDWQLNVKLLDFNDEDPKFAKDGKYECSLEEGAPNGTSVCDLFKGQVSDKDIGENARLSFRFFQSNLASQFFNIDKDTGAITTKFSKLPRLTGLYPNPLKAFILVEDNGHVPNDDETTLEVTIVDLNKHAPAFAKPLYSIVMVEERQSPVNLMTLEARDDDGPGSPTSTIVYSLPSSTVYPDNTLFQINTTTGVLSSLPNTRLDREANGGYFNLSVVASDLGMPPLKNREKFSSTNVVLTLTDVNEHAPILSTESLEGRSCTIVENAAIGFPCLEKLNAILFAATDKDISADASTPTNSAITFEVDGDNHQKFKVASTNGMITTIAQMPNFELLIGKDTKWKSMSDNPSYKLKVRATDSGKPSAKTSPQSGEITIFVEDAPEFNPTAKLEGQELTKLSTTSFQLSVEENTEKLVAKLTVEDQDRGQFGVAGVGVNIVGGQNGFEARPSATVPGEFGIWSLKNLNYEKNPKLTIKIHVTDAGGIGFNMKIPISVEVTVEDVNDFPPSFDSGSNNTEVIAPTYGVDQTLIGECGAITHIQVKYPETTVAPTPVLILRANDVDTASTNAGISYSIVSDDGTFVVKSCIDGGQCSSLCKTDFKDDTSRCTNAASLIVAGSVGLDYLKKPLHEIVIRAQNSNGQPRLAWSSLGVSILVQPLSYTNGPTHLAFAVKRYFATVPTSIATSDTVLTVRALNTQKPDDTRTLSYVFAKGTSIPFTIDEATGVVKPLGSLASDPAGKVYAAVVHAGYGSTNKTSLAFSQLNSAQKASFYINSKTAPLRIETRTSAGLIVGLPGVTPDTEYTFPVVETTTAGSKINPGGKALQTLKGGLVSNIASRSGAGAIGPSKSWSLLIFSIAKTPNSPCVRARARARVCL